MQSRNGTLLSLKHPETGNLSVTSINKRISCENVHNNAVRTIAFNTHIKSAHALEITHEMGTASFDTTPKKVIGFRLG